ncbi:MAG: FAD-dependent oxidoreductase [Raoultibacter sp.]
MAESDFDAIVVGSGCAGSVAAYELAKAGKSVLVVERGNHAGAKNMTGGRLYAHALREVFPDFESEAPVERKISHEKISLMAPDSNFTVDFSSDDMLVPGQESYSILRGNFDPWLAEKAEEAGAEYIYGIAVESLMKDGDKVCGIIAGEDEITADIVLLCDGVNSLLTPQAVGAARPSAHAVAVGVKQTIELPADTIQDRALAADGEGCAWLFAGSVTDGKVGGGFMYTNKDSVSLGVVSTIADVASGDTPVYQMLENLKNHPAVAPIIRGGKVVEHSGHMVPEGGYDMMPTMIGNGVMLAGESAMMCINLGYMVRGMDYAIASGMYAGRNAVKALDKGDTSKAGLQSYVDDLNNSFIMQDFKNFSKFPHFLEGATRVFTEYPLMIRDIFNSMFVVNGKPMTSVKKTGMARVKQVGYMNLLKDVRGGMKAL